MQLPTTDSGNKMDLQSGLLASYRFPLDWIILVELFLSAYAAAGLMLCLISGNMGPIFFMLTCTLGFAYVALVSIQEHLTLR